MEMQDETVKISGHVIVGLTRTSLWLLLTTPPYILGTLSYLCENMFLSFGKKNTL